MANITIEFMIPRNIPESTPLTRVFDLGVNARVIKSIDVTIPEGHKGLARLRVYTPGRNLIPADGSSVKFIRGDNSSISGSGGRLEGPPFNLYCEGWNEDSFLSHTFIINIDT